MRFYNQKGIFSNEQDTLQDLKSALRDRYDEVSFQIKGCVALFSAQKKAVT